MPDDQSPPQGRTLDQTLLAAAQADEAAYLAVLDLVAQTYADRVLVSHPAHLRALLDIQTALDALRTASTRRLQRFQWPNYDDQRAMGLTQTQTQTRRTTLGDAP